MDLVIHCDSHYGFGYTLWQSVWISLYTATVTIDLVIHCDRSVWIWLYTDNLYGFGYTLWQSIWIWLYTVTVDMDLVIHCESLYGIEDWILLYPMTIKVCFKVGYSYILWLFMMWQSLFKNTFILKYLTIIGRNNQHFILTNKQIKYITINKQTNQVYYNKQTKHLCYNLLYSTTICGFDSSPYYNVYSIVMNLLLILSFVIICCH